MVEKKGKVGVGIITCNRQNFLHKLLDSLDRCAHSIDELVIVNDGDSTIDIGNRSKITVINNKVKQHVGGSKNVAMAYLLEEGCEYIFTLEDDILIKDKNVFYNYINAHKTTGISHFNFGFSQRENLDSNLKPLIRKRVEYSKDFSIILTQNILGAFTFYTKNALRSIGLHHYKFNKGHGDHPELTFRAYKHGLTTPFWWFADIDRSWEMIENQSNLQDDSLVRTQKEFWNNFNEANEIFKSLHGYKMTEVPDVPESIVIQTLKEIKKRNE